MTTKLIVKGGTIKVYYSFKGEILRENTGISVSDNFTGERFTYKEKDFQTKNNKITSLQTRIEEIINNYWIKHNQKPPVEHIKDELKNRPEEVVKYDFVNEYYVDFVNYKESSLIRKSSMKDYYSLKNSLILYQHINRKKLNLSDINNFQFLKKFEGFLSRKHDLTDEERKKYKTIGGVNHNTLTKRISTLRSFLIWLERNKVISKNELEKEKLSVKKYIPTIITFTTDELKKLKKLKGLKKEDELIRDIMLFLCLTGVSYTDMTRITKHYIEKDNNSEKKNSFKLVMKRQKVGTLFEVPLLPDSMIILKKYDYNLNHLTNQHFNREVKELLKNNKLCDYEIKIEEHRGNNQEDRNPKKYEEISSHTGRRTFISRCVIENVPISIIMGMTGHKKLDTLQHYINLFQETDRNKLLQRISF